MKNFSIYNLQMPMVLKLKPNVETLNEQASTFFAHLNMGLNSSGLRQVLRNLKFKYEVNSLHVNDYFIDFTKFEN